MSLDASYLRYEKRRHGMDHDLYPWSNIMARKPVSWPDGRTVALFPVVSLEWFPLEPADKPFRAPGHMQTPYPDYRHYTARDYGSRVGIYRLLDAFARRSIRASVAVNAAIATRYPALIEDILRDGHELIAHATSMNDTIATGLDESAERALIGTAMATLEKAMGVRPRGWHSIARSQSWNTPRLLAEAGCDYMVDWVNDDLPYVMSTPAGTIVNIPLNHELSDRQILNVQQNPDESYAEQMRDAFAWLSAEGRRHGGRLLPMHLTPYIIALPYRIDMLEALLDWLIAQPQAWFATGSQIHDSWLAQQ